MVEPISSPLWPYWGKMIQRCCGWEQTPPNTNRPQKSTLFHHSGRRQQQKMLPWVCLSSNRPINHCTIMEANSGISGFIKEKIGDYFLAASICLLGGFFSLKRSSKVMILVGLLGSCSYVWDHLGYCDT